MPKLVEPKKAYEIARMFHPTIYQEFKDIRDLITPILLGEATQFAIIHALKIPIIYFRIMEDQYYYYNLFMFYHPFDWSDSPFGLLNKADSHRHDTECALFRIPKKDAEKPALCTVSHNSLLFDKNFELEIFIHAETHAIEPSKPKDLSDKKAVLVYNKYAMDNMGEYTDEDIKKLTSEFNKYKVNFPTQMYDNVLKIQSINERDEFKHEQGDLWYKPDRVFKCAERFGKLC